MNFQKKFYIVYIFCGYMFAVQLLLEPEVGMFMVLFGLKLDLFRVDKKISKKTFQLFIQKLKRESFC